MPQIQDLYPELTTEEIELIIGPLSGGGSDHEGHGPAVRSEELVASIELPLTAFGPTAEPHSFERVCRHVADCFLDRYWHSRDSALIHDTPSFATDLRRALVEDVMELSIRPLADGLRPSPGVHDGLRYQQYCRSLLADGLGEVSGRHPVLSDRLRTRLRNRIEAVDELVARLEADLPALTQHLGISSSARLDGLSLAGDTHCAGRTVSVVRFDDGSAVVYKPRPVSGEAGYRALVDRLHAQFGCQFRAASVLERTGYGYVEFIESDPGEKVDIFRVGELAALLYALNARDMHFTNILSSPDGPVPVDLETLLHPHRQKSIGTSEVSTSGYRILAESVFGTGVLPMIVTHRDREGFVDVGYLGGGEIHGSGPFRQFRVEHPFSARIKVSWAPETTPDHQAERDLDTAAAAVRANCSRMVEGFTQTYTLIRTHRDWFVKAVRACFVDAEVRYVHNATVQYVQCLRTLTGTSASSDIDLAKGLVKRIGIASRGAATALVESECAQMWRTDVPYFLIGANRRDITDGSQARTLLAHTDASPLEQFEAKLAGLSERDLERQVRLIRVAFNAKLPDPHTMAPGSEVMRVAPKSTSSPGALRDLAAEIGHGLVADMVHDRYAHLPQTWIGPVATAVANRPWPPGVLGYDLYTGRTGPALTLAALAKVLGEPRFAEASLRVFEPAARILTERSYEDRSLLHAGHGAYSGLPGALWAMAHAGCLLDEPELVATARRSLDCLGPSGAGADDAWFDTISGGVGSLLVRLTLGDRTATTESVTACARALDTGVARRLEYSGLAHGLAGLLHFAARGHAVAGDRPSRHLALEVLAELERSFRTSSGGLRTNRTGPENYSDSWCNGTVGIIVAMSSAVTAGLLEPEAIGAILETIPASSMATSATLCHGALGMYDALGHLPGPLDPVTGGLRDRLAGYLTVDRLRAFLVSPDSRYNQGPCLMVGRAGIAWHLLDRLGEDLPSPLHLGPVPAHG